MPSERNEVSYYPEIQRFIEQQIRSNFRVGNGRNLNVYWGIGELKSNLQRIISEHPDECLCARRFSQNVPPLNLDIFGLITNGEKFELLILEVKLLRSAGLKELSQLIGYCLVSGAKYGLLINIDGGSSERLTNILSTERHLSHIKTLINNEPQEHLLGLMQWDSLTQNFEYSGLGAIRTLSELSRMLSDEFNI